VALLALVNHVVKFDFQALLSFDRLQARITSTKSRRFIQVAANDSFRVADDSGVTDGKRFSETNGWHYFRLRSLSESRPRERRVGHRSRSPAVN